MARDVGSALAAAMAVAACGLAWAAPAGAAGCGKGSWTAGTVDLCAGVLVYRDYVYDDYGADTGRCRASVPARSRRLRGTTATRRGPELR